MTKQQNTQSRTIAFALLPCRLVLFLFFQVLIALFAKSWLISEKYWLLSASFTNVVSIALLYSLFKREGKNYLHIFKINKSGLKKDILIFLGISLITVPVVFAPGYFLSTILWDDPNVPTQMMFGTIENWLIYILMIAFPISIAFAELATYFAYIMPRLKEQMKRKYLVVLLPVIFLSIQHITLPFIPDLNFMIYRALVFLPFALLIGLSVYFRPSLFIYFAILHGVMDFGTALMFLLEIN